MFWLLQDLKARGLLPAGRIYRVWGDMDDDETALEDDDGEEEEEAEAEEEAEPKPKEKAPPRPRSSSGADRSNSAPHAERRPGVARSRTPIATTTMGPFCGSNGFNPGSHANRPNEPTSPFHQAAPSIEPSN